MIYTYSLSNDFPGGQVNTGALEIAIRESSISKNLIDVTADLNNNIVTIEFDSALSVGDKFTLDGNQLGPSAGLISTTPTRPFIDNNVRSIVLGYFPQVNMASTQDQPFFITTSPYIVKRIVVCNATDNLNMAKGGIYSQRGKTGIVYVSSMQCYTTLNDSSKFMELNLNPALLMDVMTKQELFFSLTTGQSNPATLDLIVYGDDLSNLQ